MTGRKTGGAGRWKKRRMRRRIKKEEEEKLDYQQERGRTDRNVSVSLVCGLLQQH